MSNKTKRFILPEEEIPHYWYNIQADMVNKPMPPLNPATKQPLKAEDLYPVLQKSSAAKNSIRPMPGLKYPNRCAKCTNTTEALRWCVPTDWKSAGYTGTYLFQNESVSPMGSHKLNSAIPQAYYCKQEGVTNVTTETGAGQWGASLAYAARLFGLEAAVYQVKSAMSKSLTAAVSCRPSVRR